MKTLFIMTLLILNTSFAAMVNSTDDRSNGYINVEQLDSGYTFEICNDEGCNVIGEEGVIYSKEKLNGVVEKIKKDRATIRLCAPVIGVVVGLWAGTGSLLGATVATHNLIVGIAAGTGVIAATTAGIKLSLNKINHINPKMLEQLFEVLKEITSGVQIIEVETHKIQEMAEVLERYLLSNK